MGKKVVSYVVLVVNNLPVNTVDVRNMDLIPGLGRFLEKGMTTHSSIFAMRNLASYSP